jgi:hypothetical protein
LFSCPYSNFLWLQHSNVWLIAVKPIEQQTYYEILEVEPNASAHEIQRAYERCRETFQSDSVAIYSLFSEPEVRKIQIAIEEAYRVLLEEALRRNLDPSQVQKPGKQRWEEPLELGRGPKEISGIKGTKENEGAGPIHYRGETLKQIREKMNFDLQTISAETRINPKILQAIEEEAREKFPPRVYLKGFLRSYARSLGLDPAPVVEGYLRFLDGDKKK